MDLLSFLDDGALRCLMTDYVCFWTMQNGPTKAGGRCQVVPQALVLSTGFGTFPQGGSEVNKKLGEHLPLVITRRFLMFWPRLVVR